MILCITALLHDAALLPYYLEHYRRLGVDRFVIGADVAPASPPAEMLQSAMADGDVDVVPLSTRFRRTRLVGMNEEEVRRSRARATDWVIPADLDELNEYPMPLRELVEDVAASRCTHVVGELRDHLAPHGVLAPLRPFADGIPIWAQFPFEAPVTTTIAGGASTKVLLARGDQSLWLGHHRLAGGPGTPFPTAGVAHHFKWRAGLMETLAWRIENERRFRTPWLVESERLSTYLRRHGRFDLAGLGARRSTAPFHAGSAADVR